MDNELIEKAIREHTFSGRAKLRGVEREYCTIGVIDGKEYIAVRGCILFPFFTVYFRIHDRKTMRITQLKRVNGKIKNYFVKELHDILDARAKARQNIVESAS